MLDLSTEAVEALACERDEKGAESRMFAEAILRSGGNPSAYLHAAEHAEHTARVLRGLVAERDALQDRLEMRHAFKMRDDGHLVRIPVVPGSIPDGISARDETIRGQDQMIDSMREAARRVTALLTTAELDRNQVQAELAEARKLIEFWFSPWGAAKGAMWEEISGDRAFEPGVMLELLRKALTPAVVEPAS